MNIIRNLVATTVFLPSLALVAAEAPRNATLKTAGGPLVQAHRGSRHEYDDNALGGFRWCLGKGIRGFEVDLKYTKDLQIVVMHDTDVARTTDGTGCVEELTLAEIRRLRLKASSEPVPTLDELLDVLGGRSDIFVEFEMKVQPDDFYGGQGRLAPFCREICQKVEARMAKGTYCFTAWSPYTLKTFRKVNPAAPLGFIIVEPMTDVDFAMAKALDCCTVAPTLDTEKSMIDKAHAAGMSVCLWPTPDLESYNRAKALGADRVTTDYAYLLECAIRGNRKKLVAVDLDSVCSRPRSLIPPESLKALDALVKKYRCAMVGAANAPHVSRQMAGRPVDLVGDLPDKHDATLEWAKAQGCGPGDVVFVGNDFSDGGSDCSVRVKGMDHIVIDNCREFAAAVSVLLK